MRTCEIDAENDGNGINVEKGALRVQVCLINLARTSSTPRSLLTFTHLQDLYKRIKYWKKGAGLKWPE